MSSSLTRIVSWGHQLLAEKLRAGNFAVDLTAGNGYDALMLWRLVGAEGQVVAFDVQEAALLSTRQKLQESGAAVRLWENPRSPVPHAPGVDLLKVGHESLADYLPATPQAIIANLGYFPSGDKQITTQVETTLMALQQSSAALAVGGRLAVVVYIGHPEGKEEAAAVDEFFAGLDDSSFEVLQVKVGNRPEAPYLLVAEKRWQGVDDDLLEDLYEGMRGIY